MTQEIYIHAKIPQNKTSEFIQLCNSTFFDIGSTINYIKTEQYWKNPLCNTICISYYTNQKLTFDNWKLILEGLVSTEPEILFDNNEEIELGSYPLLGSDSVWLDCIIPKSCIRN